MIVLLLFLRGNYFAYLFYRGILGWDPGDKDLWFIHTKVRNAKNILTDGKMPKKNFFVKI